LAGSGLRILSLYAGPPRGGCYSRLVRLHAALARRGEIVHAVTQTPSQEPVAGVVVHPLPGPAGALSLYRIVSASLFASRVAKTEQVDAFLAFGSANAALLLPFRQGRKLVTFLRGNWMEQEKARGSGAGRLALARWVEGRALLASTRVMAVARGLTPHSVDPLLLPNDAPTPRLIGRQTARERLHLPQDAFIVGTLGVPAPVKSLETIIDATRATRSAHLVMSGFGDSGAYEASLRTRSLDLVQAGRAHILGWVDRDLLLSALDLLVVTSRSEGSPNGLLEAMAAGLPCLGSRVPGVEETLVASEMLFPFGDVKALAARLDEVEASPQIRSDLARRALERSQAYRFDWDEVASAAVLAALRKDKAAE
jgi:glycosyltransferase involved in cell wall biosynthesis